MKRNMFRSKIRRYEVAALSFLFLSACSGTSSSSISYSSQLLGTETLLYVSNQVDDFTAVGAIQNEDAFLTIQEAVYHAANDAVIRVFPGTYAESVFLDRSVRILAQSAEEDTILYPSQTSDLLSGFIFKAVSPSLTLQIEGLTFQGDHPDVGERASDVHSLIVVEQNDSSLSLLNNEFYNANQTAVTFAGENGIFYAESNLIDGVESTLNGSGFDISYASDIEITDNDFRDVNTAITVRSVDQVGSKGIVSENTIQTRNQGIWLKNINAGSFQIANNTMELMESVSGIGTGIRCSYVKTGNEILLQSNGISDFKYGVQLHDSDAPRIIINHVTMNEVETAILLGASEVTPDGLDNYLTVRGSVTLTNVTHLANVKTTDATTPSYLVFDTGTYTLGSASITASGTQAIVVPLDSDLSAISYTGVTPDTAILRPAVAGVHPITNSFELMALESSPTADVLLQNSIDLPLDWKSILQYQGDFNGNNLQIRQVSAPIFATLQGANVQDLTLYGKVTLSLTTNYGAIAQRALDSSSIQGIESYVEVIANGVEETLGGIVGELNESVLSQCINRRDIIVTDEESNGSIGAIVGESTHSLISNSINYAMIQSRSGYVGGIVGTAKEGSTVSSNQNRGIIKIVTVDGTNYSIDALSTGGIIGYVMATSIPENGITSVTSNHNYREVKAPRNVGGIVGWSEIGMINNNTNWAPQGVYNSTSGTIIEESVTQGLAENFYSGFLVGRVD